MLAARDSQRQARKVALKSLSGEICRKSCEDPTTIPKFLEIENGTSDHSKARADWNVGRAPNLMQAIISLRRLSLPAQWRRARTAWAALLLALSLASLYTLDTVVISDAAKDAVPGELRIFLNHTEPFGHGYGVGLILISLWVVTRCDRRRIGVIACCSYGAGIAADVVKICIGRLRPSALAEQELASSFRGLMPLVTESWSDLLNTAHHSFPSAHTATAFGLAVGLAHFYPTGRTWFMTLATLVATQRIVSGSHFPSDAFFGAAIGIVIGYHVLDRAAATTQQQSRDERQPITIPISKAHVDSHTKRNDRRLAA